MDKINQVLSRGRHRESLSSGLSSTDYGFQNFAIMIPEGQSLNAATYTSAAAIK